MFCGTQDNKFDHLLIIQWNINIKMKSIIPIAIAITTRTMV